jgi:hypothetical protein
LRISYPAKNHSFAVYAAVSTSVTISCQAGLTCFTPLLGGPAFFLPYSPRSVEGVFYEVRGYGFLRSSHPHG